MGLSMGHETEGGSLGGNHLPPTFPSLGEDRIIVGDEWWVIFLLPLGGRAILCGEVNYKLRFRTDPY